MSCPKFDPRAMGAQCDRCILSHMRQGDPVPSEMNPGSKYAIVAEAPGRVEAEIGRPLVGESGQEVMRGLISLGVNRFDASWMNAISCRPPGNDLDRLMRRLKRVNVDRVKAGERPYLSPMEACRPRFVNELRMTRNVIALGKTSFGAITRQNRTIFDVRGMPFEGTLDGAGQLHTSLYIPTAGELISTVRMVPTVHPAFVLRTKRWRTTFRRDLARALRWFDGTLQWKEPERVFQPTPAQLEAFLFGQKHRFLTYDVETDAKESLIARLRCIGIGTPETVYVVGLLSIDGYTRLYNSEDEAAILEILRRFFEDRTILKTGHNAGIYDRLVIEQQLGVTPVPVLDSILLHRAVESELPHSLAYVGSVYTDVMDAWKSSHTAVTAPSDYDLHVYNGTDVIVSARTIQPLMDRVIARGLLDVVKKHHRIQEFCAGMHRAGMFVDQQRRREHDAELKFRAFKEREFLRQIVGRDDFNPNSRNQVSEVLFDAWGLTPDVVYANDPSATKKLKKAYTSDNSPSTGDDLLRAMLLHVKKDEGKTAFIQSLRRFRGAAKLRGTNIIPLRPYDEPYSDDDFQVNADELAGRLSLGEDTTSDWVDIREGKSKARQDIRADIKRGKLLKPGLVLGDGRVHPNFNPHVATSQRLSSSEPNAQNIRRWLRDMFCATATKWRTVNGGLLPERWDRAIVSADMDQLELRFMAGLANCARYLEVFDLATKLAAQGYSEDEIKARGGDPHNATCEMIYGAKFKNANAKDKKRLRDFGKRFTYAAQYRASLETIFETLVASEDEKGVLVFPDLTMREVRASFDKWIGANPEILRWWESDLASYRKFGYLTEPVFGWRRDFLDGEDENEIANFRAQSGGAAIVHEATFRILERIPFERWGPGTGLIQQGHDALVFEVAATHAPVELKQDPVTKRWSVEEWCEPGCKCVTAQAARDLTEAMTVDGRAYGLPVTFTAKAKIGFRWSET